MEQMCHSLLLNCRHLTRIPKLEGSLSSSVQETERKRKYSKNFLDILQALKPTAQFMQIWEVRM